MNIQETASLFATPQRKAALKKVIKDKKIKKIAISGLAGSAPAMLFASLDCLDTPALIIASDADSAGYLYNDINTMAPGSAVIFPSGYKRHIRYGQPDEPARILRMESLDAVAARRKDLRWIVTSPDAIAEKVADAESLGNFLGYGIMGRNVTYSIQYHRRPLGF